MLRKRVTASSRARSSSRPAKKGKYVVNPAPRFKLLRNPSDYTIAQSMRVKMTYSTFFTINPGIGAVGTYLFSANGIYDPDVTGAGHQPAGFDELMNLYAEYVVVGSTIRVIARSSADNQDFFFGVALERTTATYTDFDRYVENGNCKWTWCDAPNRGGESHAQVFHKCDMRMANTDVLTDSDFFGTNAANPAEQRFYHILCCPCDRTSDIGAQNFSVVIDFDVIFRDRVTTNIS